LFNFDVHDDVRLLHDATKERDEVCRMNRKPDTCADWHFTPSHMPVRLSRGVGISVQNTYSRHHGGRYVEKRLLPSLPMLTVTSTGLRPGQGLWCLRKPLFLLFATACANTFLLHRRKLLDHLVGMPGPGSCIDMQDVFILPQVQCDASTPFRFIRGSAPKLGAFRRCPSLFYRKPVGQLG
jgi:hypothetical protein